MFMRNEGLIEILLAHPASMAYGLNLQSGTIPESGRAGRPDGSCESRDKERIR